MPKKLSDQEAHILLEKGTEPPFTGEYYRHFQNGIYVCRQCEAPLYRSYDKFDSGCGWPAFDDEFPNAIRRQLDRDGRRTEVLCQQCDGHLGHVFSGEYLTEKNTRHCINSLSMQFVPIDKLDEFADHFESAYFAAGCFWGVEHRFIQLCGVVATEVGYSGGELEAPSYEAVCRGDTGHAETLHVIFDKRQLSYQDCLAHFFAIHDATQLNRQGVDHGRQYRSAIFANSNAQFEQANQAIASLKSQGIPVVTEVVMFTKFWPAEAYHQHYHKKK